MNSKTILDRLHSRQSIRNANQSIKESKQAMNATQDSSQIRCFTGYTDPEERTILKNGGNLRDVELLRKSKALTAAPALLAQMQAGKKPS